MFSGVGSCFLHQGHCTNDVLALVQYSTRAGRKLSLSADQMLSIARTRGTVSKVERHGVGKTLAKRTTAVVAHVIMRSQAVYLQRLTRMMETSPPDWCVVHMTWDETGQRCASKVTDSDSPRSLPSFYFCIHRNHSR